MKDKKIAVFASGKGSNFAALAGAVKKWPKADIALLVCDTPGAAVLNKAKRAAVKSVLVERKNFSSRAAFERKITAHLKNEKIDVIVLAGFMRLLSPLFVRKFKNRILNIHPALLPAFKGEHGIRDAFDYGVKTSGVTVHFVDEKMDHGPIILQQAVPIRETDTLETLEKRIHAIEHRLYPNAVKLLIDEKLKITGRKVLILR
ncbi:MAG: phosphoribosylglycinamide formyltransferase [Candidatus Omnitrophica bacterium]|nr:phosphoribosylglycinamide formyltransferase [Candidatus Omnitrophota bacterium]